MSEWNHEIFFVNLEYKKEHMIKKVYQIKKNYTNSIFLVFTIKVYVQLMPLRGITYDQFV